MGKNHWQPNTTRRHTLKSKIGLQRKAVAKGSNPLGFHFPSSGNVCMDYSVAGGSWASLQQDLVTVGGGEFGQNPRQTLLENRLHYGTGDPTARDN